MLQIPSKVRETFRKCALKRVYNPNDIQDNLYLIADAIQSLEKKYSTNKVNYLDLIERGSIALAHLMFNSKKVDKLSEAEMVYKIEQEMEKIIKFYEYDKWV